MRKFVIIALVLSLAGPALAQSRNGGGNGTMGSTATGLSVTGLGSGMNNGGRGMNKNGPGMSGNGAGMNNNRSGMNSSNRMNGAGSSQE
jgi:hypothetical protein